MTTIKCAVNPLDLPEIRAIVENYLSTHNLVQCIRVNRDWHKSFLPSIWGNTWAASSRQVECPSVESLERHRHLIRCLTFQLFMDLETASMTFPNLKTLSIALVEVSAQSESPVTTLLSRNPSSLTHLKLHSTYADWNAILKLTNLDTLELINVHGLKSTSHLWAVCTRLKTLTLEAVDIQDLHELAEDAMFLRLTSLNILRMGSLQDMDSIEFVRRCPNLENLHICAGIDGNGSTTARTFVQLFKTGTWPRLKGLEYIHSRILEDDAACVLLAMEGCTRWKLPLTGFGLSSFQALRNHFSTLAELDLGGCKTVSSKMFQDVLSSCPKLRTFRGGRIEARHIAEGRPWVCRFLKSLIVFIDFEIQPTEARESVAQENLNDGNATVEHTIQTEGEMDLLQRQVYEQLSQLHRLAVLIVGYCPEYIITGRSRHHCGLDLRVQKGLHLLANLKELQLIRFFSTAQIMEQADVEWMVDHWTQLQQVEGTLNCKDRELNLKLFGMLSIRNLRVRL